MPSLRNLLLETQSTTVLTLSLDRGEMRFLRNLSTEDEIPSPSSIVDDGEALKVLHSFLGTDAQDQIDIDHEGQSSLDILDEVFQGSDTSEQLIILEKCYAATGLNAKIYKFSGYSQGDYIEVLSVDAEKKIVEDNAQTVREFAFDSDEDDDIYESSVGRDGHVYTIVKRPSGEFKYDASLSSSHRLPYPEEVLEKTWDEDAELIVQEFGGSVGGANPHRVLKTLFDESDTVQQLHILEKCFKVSGAGYTQIYHPYDGEDEIYILAVAASKGQANQRAMDVIHIMNDRIRDREDEDYED